MMLKKWILLILLLPNLALADGGGLGMENVLYAAIGLGLFIFHLVLLTVYCFNRNKSTLRALLFNCLLAPLGIFSLLSISDSGLNTLGKVYIFIAIISLVLPIFFYLSGKDKKKHEY
jgi:hypothetical protein